MFFVSDVHGGIYSLFCCPAFPVHIDQSQISVTERRTPGASGMSGALSLGRRPAAAGSRSAPPTSPRHQWRPAAETAAITPNSAIRQVTVVSDRRFSMPDCQ